MRRLGAAGANACAVRYIARLQAVGAVEARETGPIFPNKALSDSDPKQGCKTSGCRLPGGRRS
jgi:hypothetical protein